MISSTNLLYLCIFSPCHITIHYFKENLHMLLKILFTNVIKILILRPNIFARREEDLRIFKADLHNIHEYLRLLRRRSSYIPCRSSHIQCRSSQLLAITFFAVLKRIFVDPKQIFTLPSNIFAYCEQALRISHADLQNCKKDLRR